MVKKKRRKKTKKSIRKKGSSKNSLSQLEKFFSDISKSIEKFLFSPAPNKRKFEYKILNTKKQKNTLKKKKRSKRKKAQSKKK